MHAERISDKQVKLQLLLTQGSYWGNNAYLSLFERRG